MYESLSNIQKNVKNSYQNHSNSDQMSTKQNEDRVKLIFRE